MEYFLTFWKVWKLYFLTFWKLWKLILILLKVKKLDFTTPSKVFYSVYYEGMEFVFLFYMMEAV